MVKKVRIVYPIRRKLQVLAYNLTSPEFVSRIYSKHLLGYSLNLDNPTTFNEKLQWLKLYEWPNNQTAITCTDKYAARKYFIEKGIGQYLNELIGVWDKVNEINWEVLPQQFALKCTHGSGYNIICDNKANLDIERSKKKLRRWLKEDYGQFGVEPHYSKIKPRIICEKYLDKNMIDYKFFCFNGKVEFMYITKYFLDSATRECKFYDKNGLPIPPMLRNYIIYKNASLPNNFEKMKLISEKISSEFPFVRVDLYEVKGKIYLGELTFTPLSGLKKIIPEEYDIEWGRMLNIQSLIKKPVEKN